MTNQKRKGPDRIGPAKFARAAQFSGARGLPVYSYKDYISEQSVVYSHDDDEADNLIQGMDLSGPLWFDMKWHVDKDMKALRTALVQICDGKTILLLQEVIESSTVIKLGVWIHNDAIKLYADYGISAKELLDLKVLAYSADLQYRKIFGKTNVSLARIVSMYTGKELSKGPVRTSNWEQVLSNLQKECTSSDAHCAVVVYNRLMEITKMADQVVDIRQLAVDFALGDLRGSRHDILIDNAIPVPIMQAKWMEVYRLWYEEQVLFHEIRVRLGWSPENPFRTTGAISCVVHALQADANLSYSLPRLKELIQMDLGSWKRYRCWIVQEERHAEFHQLR
ncbi:ribonuclease H-like protein [Neolentinus lepideus HHB14362 ss-1]|uniref:Ribonuclease H-like protein n=1 Tax=Neolentinus lepideus HHB14362 ss-1 TaxID=1314782 RepID=A0A165QUY3_9AGAM|nr:ribonuclease H-like protein [Neolentinus lepideus HHB14362 ss-1]